MLIEEFKYWEKLLDLEGVAKWVLFFSFLVFVLFFFLKAWVNYNQFSEATRCGAVGLLKCLSPCLQGAL